MAITPDEVLREIDLRNLPEPPPRRVADDVRDYLDRLERSVEGWLAEQLGSLYHELPPEVRSQVRERVLVREVDRLQGRVTSDAERWLPWAVGGLFLWKLLR